MTKKIILLYLTLCSATIVGSDAGSTPKKTTKENYREMADRRKNRLQVKNSTLLILGAHTKFQKQTCAHTDYPSYDTLNSGQIQGLYGYEYFADCVWDSTTKEFDYILHLASPLCVWIQGDPSSKISVPFTKAHLSTPDSAPGYFEITADRTGKHAKLLAAWKVTDEKKGTTQ